MRVVSLHQQGPWVMRKHVISILIQSAVYRVTLVCLVCLRSYRCGVGVLCDETAASVPQVFALCVSCYHSCC